MIQQGKIAVLAALLSMGASKGMAQADTWSLDQCVEYGIKHSPITAREAAQVGIYQQNLKESIAQQLPSVSANASAGWTIGRLPDPKTNEYINESRIFGNRMSIGAEMTIFSGFSLTNSSRMAYVNQLAGLEHQLQAANSHGVTIATAYYNTLFKQGLMALASEQLSQSEQQLKQLTRMSELGMKSKSDVAEIRAKHASDCYNLTQATNDYLLAMVNLKQAMSYPQTDTLTLPQNLTSNIAGEVTPQLLFEKAATTQPRVKEAEYKLRKSLLRVYVAKGMLLPTLTASGGYATSYSKNLIKGGDDAYTRQLKDLASHYVEFNLRIPLFTGLKHRSDIRRSQLENLIEKTNYEETMQQLYAEVSKAVAEYEGAAEAVKQALRQQEAQDIAYQTNLRKYTDGLIGIIELHSSANNLLKAKVETLKAQALHAFSARIISYFEGNLFVDKL